jgi:hypothetical protein
MKSEQAVLPNPCLEEEEEEEEEFVSKHKVKDILTLLTYLLTYLLHGAGYYLKS